MSSHDCRVTGTVTLNQGVTPEQVAAALESFMVAVGLKFSEQVAQGNIVQEAGRLTLNLDLFGHGGSDNVAVQALADSLSGLCAGPEWIELDDFDTGDTDTACTPYFLGDEATRTLGKVLYGIDLMREWVEPTLGKEAFLAVEDLILSLGAGNNQEGSPLFARKVIEGLLKVLHPGAVGLIANHHGNEAMQRACTAITAAKTYLHAIPTSAAPSTPVDHDHLLQCFAPELLGEHEDYGLVAEWQWIEAHASFAHTEVADRIVHVETAALGDVPAQLQPAFTDAKARGMHWLLFHLGH